MSVSDVFLDAEFKYVSRIYHLNLSCCIRLCESTSLHVSHWGPVGGSLDM